VSNPPECLYIRRPILLHICYPRQDLLELCLRQRVWHFSRVNVYMIVKYAFQALCAARWLTQVGRHAQGKRQCCPLCSQKVVCSANGKLSSCGSDSCS